MLSPSPYAECDLKMAADAFCQDLELILDTRNILGLLFSPCSSRVAIHLLSILNIECSKSTFLTKQALLTPSSNATHHQICHAGSFSQAAQPPVLLLLTAPGCISVFFTADWNLHWKIEFFRRPSLQKLRLCLRQCTIHHLTIYLVTSLPLSGFFSDFLLFWACTRDLSVAALYILFILYIF